MNIFYDMPKASDEFRGWARTCEIYRNQAWRDGFISHRITNGRKTEYVTYEMPNGRVFRVAVDMSAEQRANTLKVSNIDL